MTDFSAPIQPPAVLRTSLVDAIGRRRRRVRSRAAIAGAACAAVAAAVLAGGAFTGGPERVLAIEDGSEWVTVRILDGEAGAAEMTQELQDAGIDAEVQALPAEPAAVGHWMGFAIGSEPDRHPCDLPADAPDNLICVNPPLGDDVSFENDAFQIRRDGIYKLAETPTILYVGREPEGAEAPFDAPPRTPGMDVFPAPLTFLPLGNGAR